MAALADSLLEHVPEEVYLNSEEFEYDEYLDGVVIKKTVPHKKHGRLVVLLAALIEQSEYGGAVEVRSKLGPRWIFDPESETAWQYDSGAEVIKATELSAGSLRLSTEPRA